MSLSFLGARKGLVAVELIVLLASATSVSIAAASMLPGTGIVISNHVSVTRSGVIRNRVTGLYYSTITVKNTSATNLSSTGAIDFVLNNLTPGVTLTNATGVTASGNQYKRLSTTGLNAGQSLSFDAAFNVGILTSFNY